MKKRLTVIDWILILLLCVSVLSIPFRLMHMEKPKELKELHVTLLSRNVHEQTVATLAVGDLVYTEAGDIFGRIVSFEQRPIEKSLVKDGEVIKERIDSYFLKDVSLELAILGEMRENIFLRDGKYPILSGMTVKFYTQKSSWSALVLNAWEIE